jgi:hypothetical protein
MSVVLVRDVMNVSPTRISARSTMREAAELVSSSETSDLAVVDDAGRFVGVLAEGDLIRATLPKFDEIVNSGGSVAEAFELFMLNGKRPGRPADRPDRYSRPDRRTSRRRPHEGGGRHRLEARPPAPRGGGRQARRLDLARRYLPGRPLAALTRR